MEQVTGSMLRRLRFALFGPVASRPNRRKRPGEITPCRSALSPSGEWLIT